MSEISKIRPWEHINTTTDKTEYHIDVHRAGMIEPDSWQFGTNRDMWLSVIEVMGKTLPTDVPRRTFYVDAGDLSPEEVLHRIEGIKQAYPAMFGA